MVEKKPIVALDEAYWWLNNPDAPFLRPPLHEFLARFSEAEEFQNRQAVEKICQQFVEKESKYLRSPGKEMVEKLHNAVKIWIARDIETARKKLNEAGGSYLRNPTYAYVLKMREAVSQDPAKARVPLERLYSMSREISDGLEAGEILVECGCAFYKLEDRMRTLQQFQEATRRYTSYMHQLAVVYWMIGYVNWELGLQDKALAAWRQSMNRFEKLASQRFTLAGSDPKWYREVVKRLNTSIEYAVEHEMIPKTPTAAPRKR